MYYFNNFANGINLNTDLGLDPPMDHNHPVGRGCVVAFAFALTSLLLFLALHLVSFALLVP